MTPRVQIGIHIRAPREFVFQHLLTPHHLARWFCNFTQFDPKGPAVGSKFRFGGGHAVAAADPPGWAWTVRGRGGGRPGSFSRPLVGARARGALAGAAGAGDPALPVLCGWPPHAE